MLILLLTVLIYVSLSIYIHNNNNLANHATKTYYISPSLYMYICVYK